MATSQNGWSARPDLPIRPLVVGGESFSPGVRDDDNVYAVLQYVAEQLNQRVEPIVRADWHQDDDWGFYYRPNANDPNSLSNHSSGTAIDYNATRHPNGVPTSHTFLPSQIAEIHKILREVDNVVRWGGDYTGTPDAMHFEINAGAASVARVARRLTYKPTAKLRVVSHNIHSQGRSAAGMQRSIERLVKRTHRPHVVALQEAARFGGNIGGYRMVRADGINSDDGNCILLVRNDVTILREFIIPVNGPHWMWKKIHPPRVFVGAAVLVDGQAWDVLCVHRTPGGPNPGIKSNRASWIAEDRTLVSFAARRKEKRPDRPLVLVGDQNDHAHNDEALSVRNFARGIFGRLVIKNVDGAVIRGCIGSIRKLWSKFRSDHRPVVLNLTKEN